MKWGFCLQCAYALSATVLANFAPCSQPISCNTTMNSRINPGIDVGNYWECDGHLYYGLKDFAPDINGISGIWGTSLTTNNVFPNDPDMMDKVGDSWFNEGFKATTSNFASRFYASAQRGYGINWIPVPDNNCDAFDPRKYPEFPDYQNLEGYDPSKDPPPYMSRSYEDLRFSKETFPLSKFGCNCSTIPANNTEPRISNAFNNNT